MISTSQVVDELLKQKPHLETALASDLINYSSLARYFKPEIEKRLLKSIKEGAIIMALKRAAKKARKITPRAENILKQLGDITIRSNLIDYTFLNSPALGAKIKKLIDKNAERKDIFVTISHGIGQVTIITSKSIEQEVKEIFEGEVAICNFDNLSSITISITKEATTIPGVLYYILKLLSWEGINIIECVSTFTELTIILENKDIERAFSAIKIK